MGETDYIPDVSNLSFSIPDQLHQCRFIRVAVKGKNAIDQDWPGVSNYEVTDPNLTGHIINGGNYGILPREGICILDADDESKLKNFIEVIGDTLTVRTRKGLHLYFKCEGIDPNKVVLFDPITGDHVGELYPSGCRAYCLGPGCKHPSGSIYEVENRADIITIPLEKVLKAVSFYSKPKRNTADRNDNQPQKYESLPLSEVLGLRIESVATPDGEIQHLSNGEIRGSNPWHGSESGTNYAINAQKNTWHCFRCGSGGDPATALAVKYGLIQCDEAGPGCLTADILQQIETRIRDGEEGPGYQKALMERDIEWKRSQVKKPLFDSKSYHQSPGNCSYEIPKTLYNLTDIGNAERFFQRYGNSVKYCPTLKQWFIWNNRIWEQDITLKRELYAIDTVRSIYGEAETELDENKRKKIAGWATTSESYQKRTAMLQTVSSMLAIHHEELDAKKDLFNLQNGTYNLSTHTFREHRQDDLLTKMSKASYNPDAPCPTWENHLNLIFGNDPDLINGFQELCGYSLLSGNPDEIFVICWGNGRNGKGKTLDTLAYIHGDYCRDALFDSFTSNDKYASGSGANNDMARLVGARLVRASESKAGAKLDEAKIKKISGGDIITARFLKQEFFEFTPQFILFLQTNHKPIIDNWDQAIEARIWLIPFSTFIEKKDRDKGILEKLTAEASGIFNWMIAGLKRYQEYGALTQPVAVKAANEEYRTEQDRLGEFIKNLCELKRDAIIQRRILYDAYISDCNKNSVHLESPKNFATILQTSYGIQKGPQLTGGIRTWRGIRLKVVVANEADQNRNTLPHYNTSNDLTPNASSAFNVENPSQGVNSDLTLNEKHVPNANIELSSLEAEKNSKSKCSTNLHITSTKQHIENYSKTHATSALPANGIFSSVSDWLSYYGFPADLPVREYVTILPTEKRKGLQCYCKGCEDSHPLYWIPGKYHQLCQKHMNELRSLIEKEDNQ